LPENGKANNYAKETIEEKWAQSKEKDVSSKTQHSTRLTYMLE
jgi:hypothetical protein